MYGNNVFIYIPIKHDYNYFMLHKFILTQCRNCKIMWLIMTDKDTISMPDGRSFSIDPLSIIIKILSTAYVTGKYMGLPNQTRPI